MMSVLSNCVIKGLRCCILPYALKGRRKGSIQEFCVGIVRVGGRGEEGLVGEEALLRAEV